MLTLFETLKKGIRDALFYYCDAHQLPEVPVVVVVVVVVVLEGIGGGIAATT